MIVASRLSPISLALGIVVTSLLPLRAQPPTREQVDFFESKVRPILVEHCYECHSTTAEAIEASLVLDSKSGWQTGGDSGPAIIQGKPDESLLIKAIEYQEDVVSGMPPKRKLADRQIESLRRWVEMGAPDPRLESVPRDASSVKVFDLNQRFKEHWSWRPIAAPTPPEIQDKSWPLGDIDRFILSRIESAGLRPARPASRRIWLRRVYFDLIGLPPTLAQIAQFLADESPDAYQSVVTELLDSPHFGEKWARHWMDLMRYAETHGHEFDYAINYAHEYRDYLIRAFNADVPFDQLVREHIAGDLIRKPRRHPTEDWNESIIGTGFWYLHEATHAPTDVLGNEADIVANQLDVFGKAFLGLTIACARCHDHKFDAISTADYYALSAYLQSSCRQEVALDPKRKTEGSTRQIDSLRQQAARQLRTIDAETAVRLRPGAYYETAMALVESTRGKRPGEVSDRSLDAAARERGLDRGRLRKWVDCAGKVQLTGGPRWAQENSVLLADFDGSQLPKGWTTTGRAFQATPGGAREPLALSVNSSFATPGTIDSGLAGKRQVGILRSPTFEITAQQIHVRMKATANVTVRVVIDNYYMAHYNALLFKGTFINGKQTDTGGRWAWKSLGGDLKKYIGHKAYLEFIDAGEATIAIDEIRCSDGPPPASKDVNHARRHAAYVNHLWRQAIDDLRQGRYHPLVASMLDQGLMTIGELNQDAAASLAEAADIANQLPPPRFVVAMAQGTEEHVPIYIRGGHNNLGPTVPPRFLEALGGDQGSRLFLAEQIASPDNPLTARVIVNRLWHHLFGRGIVPTVDDFGPQGQPPSHPALLDWLARDFIDHGWSLKHTTGRIVLSQTYRQDSVAHPQADGALIADVDPTNTWLHRMRVRRLPSESIRDAILAVSGRLDPTPLGPSVPTHRTPFMTGRGARPSGPLDGNGRRSIYLSVYRNFLNPFLLTFDMPSPFGPKGRRSQSNVPAQALTLMNDPLVIQQAEVWSQAVLAQPGRSDQQRIAEMVQQAHGVAPTVDEISQLARFLQEQSEIYRKVDPSGRRSSPVVDRRAWADLAHALLNMKAFYFLR